MSSITFDTDSFACPIQKLPSGWATADVTFSHRNGSLETRREIIELATGKRFLQEPVLNISIKCALIFFGSFLYAPLYLSTLALRGALLPMAIVAKHVSYFVKDPSRATAAGIGRALMKGPYALLKEIWHIVKIPLYVIGLQAAALQGIIHPLEGRKNFGELESRMHQANHYRDFRNPRFNDQNFLRLLLESLTEEEPSMTFFLGLCMQSLGKITDPHIVQHKKVAYLEAEK